MVIGNVVRVATVVLVFAWELGTLLYRVAAVVLVILDAIPLAGASLGEKAGVFGSVNFEALLFVRRGLFQLSNKLCSRRILTRRR